MMAVSTLEFRRAMAQFATGVTVVTTVDPDGRPLGLTVSAFCSVSLDPVLVLVCIDNRSETHDGFDASQAFGVSILAEGQDGWSDRFAFGDSEKFTAEPLITGANGVPFVPGAAVHLECRVHSRLPGGDHTIYVGEVTKITVKPARPLIYHGSAYKRLEPEG